MLVNQRPKSLVNGADVHVGKVMTAGNRSEFHHLFPQAYLKANGVDPAKISCLANFCIISASDNKKIGGKQPSLYRNRLSPSVVGLLPTHVIPETLFNDDFDAFVEERSNHLVAVANKLMGRPQQA
jgi:hypothetical protein